MTLQSSVGIARFVERSFEYLMYGSPGQVILTCDRAPFGPNVLCPAVRSSFLEMKNAVPKCLVIASLGEVAGYSTMTKEVHFTAY